MTAKRHKVDSTRHKTNKTRDKIDTARQNTKIIRLKTVKTIALTEHKTVMTTCKTSDKIDITGSTTEK